MKRHLVPSVLAVLAASSPLATAQGLLQMGTDDDFYSELPFTTTLAVDAGYDSNPQTLTRGSEGSAFGRGGVAFEYGSGSRTSPVRVGLSLSGLHYFDAIDGIDEDIYYDARLTLNARHQVNRRLTIGDNFLIAYEIEPDYSIGASSQRRLDQYLYGYNSLWVSYAWSRRVSTVSRYTVSGIRYDEDAIAVFEDRFSHTFGEELRYAWSRQTTAVAEYRFTLTDFDSAPRDYTAHYLLVGADHDFSRTLKGHLRVGAEFRDDDLYGKQTRPYAELALRSKLRETTTIHWANRFGLEDSDLGLYESRYTFRSALILDHRFSDRLRGHTGITYLHNEYAGGRETADISEDLVSAQVGLAYRMLPNIDVNTAYTFTTVLSDDARREYDRHLVSLGLSTTF